MLHMLCTNTLRKVMMQLLSTVNNQSYMAYIFDKYLLMHVLKMHIV